MSALEAYVNKRHFFKNSFFAFLLCLPLPLPSKNLVKYKRHFHKVENLIKKILMYNILNIEKL